MTPDQDHAELLLTAFRYISGELSADETTAFEDRLSNDQPAREALADVVELSEAIAVEEFDRCDPLRRKPAHAHDAPARDSRRGVLVAVCVIAIAGVFMLNDGRRSEHDPGHETTVDTGAPATDAVDGDADSVLSLWSELGVDDAERLRSDAILADESDELPTTENEIPDWLLTAVDGDVGETGSNLPDEMPELMDDLDQENL